VRDKVLAAASDGATAAERFGTEAFGRAAEVFRPVDIDGDGIPDQPRAAAAAEEAAAAMSGASRNLLSSCSLYLGYVLSNQSIPTWVSTR